MDKIAGQAHASICFDSALSWSVTIMSVVGAEASLVQEAEVRYARSVLGRLENTKSATYS